MWFLRSFALWRDQQINLFSFFGLLAAPGVSWGPPGGLLGASWGSPGPSWGSFGGPPWPPGRLLGASSGVLAASLDLLRRSWSLVGLMLGFLSPIWALQGFNFGRTFQSSTLISRIVLTICWRSDMTLVQLSPHRWLWRRARLACPATYSRT